MATRSNIAYKTPEGKIRSIYCHWDGYPAHNGEMLIRFYQETSKIAQLVDLGSLSALGAEVGEKQDFDDKATQNDDWTLAYHRDRGERLIIREYDDIPSWIEDMEEYAYLWNGREWLVNDHGEMDAQGFPIFSRVEDVITDEMREQLGWEK